MSNIPEIRNDSRGFGYYGAPRGNRGHRGVDLICEPNQPVRAFKPGTFTKHGFPYRDGPYRYIEIKDKQGFKARYFYCERAPGLRVGDTVKAGDIIGFCQNISKKFEDENKGKMTNHVHFEVMKDRFYIDPMKYIAEA